MTPEDSQQYTQSRVQPQRTNNRISLKLYPTDSLRNRLYSDKNMSQSLIKVVIAQVHMGGEYARTHAAVTHVPLLLLVS